VGCTATDGEKSAVGFGTYYIREERNLRREMGMGLGNYRGCQREYICDVLGGHAH
jgi:hypothetical protein